MPVYYLFIPAVVLLAGLIWAERGQQPAKVLAFKTPLSILFVVAALVSPHPAPWYFGLVLAGLILGLIGDVCLALKGDGAFRLGLVSFLLGHVAYVVAFTGLTPPFAWINPGLVAVCVVSGAVFLWLRPGLGQMMAPVLAYVVVITIMVIAAWAAVFNQAVPPAAGWVIFLGAVSFYLSDLFVARDRFKSPGWDNRLIGLPLYYGGQFAIACSVGLL